MKRRFSKKASQFHHAKRRARERHGIALTKKEYLDVCARIQRNDGTFIRRQSNRITVWELTVRDQRVRVIYDTLRHRIVTFLPLHPPTWQTNEPTHAAIGVA